MTHRPSKRCAVCGAAYSMKPREGSRAWSRRVACSKSCASRYSRGGDALYPADKTRCLACGGPVPEGEMKRGQCADCLASVSGHGRVDDAAVAAFALTAEGRAFVDRCRATGAGRVRVAL